MSDSSTDQRVFDCLACHAIDAFDGQVDGVMFGESKYHVIDERRRWQAVLDVQDRAADKVTNFAGSLPIPRKCVFRLAFRSVKLFAPTHEAEYARLNG